MADDTKTLQQADTQTGEVMERRRGANRVFKPRADIFETAESIVVVADMPGVDEGSVDITLEKNILTIDGRVEPDRHEGYRLGHREYEVGNYSRAFALSDEVDREGIEATVKNGVLRLTLPKAGPARARKIPVQG
jgi:HSP20 family molecular chaperone IbpA